MCVTVASSALPCPTVFLVTYIECSAGPAGARAGSDADRPCHRGAAVCTGDHQQPAQAAATEPQLTGSACGVPSTGRRMLTAQ